MGRPTDGDGDASISYLHGAAEAIQQRGKRSRLYYFGDYDPSGVDITRAAEEGIREFSRQRRISNSSASR
jgi:hypothetical protein